MTIADRFRKLYQRLSLRFISIAALFIIAYPHPQMFLRTVDRIFNPPVNPDAVAGIIDKLPDDPAEIERWVRRNVLYEASDYKNWGVLYYFASPEEVLPAGSAQCTGRSMVLASILEAKGIPYRIMVMPVHMWVDYDDRTPRSRLERAQYATVSWSNGRWQVLGGMAWWEQIPYIIKLMSKQVWQAIPDLVKLAFLAIAITWAAFAKLRPKSQRKPETSLY